MKIIFVILLINLYGKSKTISSVSKFNLGNPEARWPRQRKVITGLHCQFINICEIDKKTLSGCENGQKFVFKGSTEGKVNVRRQFLFLSGKAIVAFLHNGKKITDCKKKLLDITESVTCKTIPGAINLSVPHQNQYSIIQRQRKRTTKKMVRKVLTGFHCQFIDICEINKKSFCTNGQKFVFRGSKKGKKKVRRQFLILSGKKIVAFLENGKKITDCKGKLVDITRSVSCKTIPEAEEISIVSPTAGICNNDGCSVLYRYLDTGL